MTLNNIKLRILTSLILFVIIFLIINFNFVLVYFLIIFGVLSLLELLQINNKIFKNKIFKNIFNIIFIIYLFSFCYLFLLLSNFFQLKIILYTLLFGCISSDIGGYTFGKVFKGPKLSRISPNKTYSGLIGAIFLTCLFVTISFYYFTYQVNYLTIILSIVISLSCQTGDLFFSFLKRKAKIKDTGKILPGHGGILDRIDGILFGVPIGFITFIFLY
tara:strand:- start:155 stop:805 length:651 start_codon:yes stop_codon:yes gene_type:complete